MCRLFSQVQGGLELDPGGLTDKVKIAKDIIAKVAKGIIAKVVQGCGVAVNGKIEFASGNTSPEK